MATNSAVRLMLGSVALLPLAAYAEVPDEYLTTPLAEFFGAPPSIGEPMLSPDGTQLLFFQQTPTGVTMLKSLTFADASIRTLLQGSETGYDIAWCDFANETRLLCDLRQGIPERSVDYQRFYTLNIDGSDLQEMLRGAGCTDHNPSLDHRPFDRVPNDPGAILFICDRAATLLNTQSRSIADSSGAGEVGQEQIVYSNGHGLANIYTGRTDDLDRWFVRDTASSSAWQEFKTVAFVRFETPLRPAGYGQDLSQLFNFGWNEATDTWGLFRQDLAEPYDNRLIFAHDAVDIELVDTMGRQDRVVSAAFLDGRPQRAIVDRRVGEVFQFLSGLLPGIDLEIVDESWDQNVYLARAWAPNRAAEFLLVDMENEQVSALPPEYEHFAGYDLAETRLVEFEGADGGSITAHLTLPGTSEGPVPAVIIPRAEASHEDVAEPHYLVQFLAASGYAVLRVQNRVEDEYGRGWLPERAVVGWQQTADDLSAAADYLVANGISVTDRICGAGKNYGAYAAFMAAIRHPELFSCIVSIAAIADPRLTPGAPVIRRNVSGVSEDLLDTASPVRRAGEIDPPVLMFHGENDPDVSMPDHTVTLFNVLNRAGKNARFIEYPYGTHEFRRGPYRIDMLTRIGAFLEEHIGPATPRIQTETATETATGTETETGT